MSEPESIGSILGRIFPSLIKRAELMEQETVELVKCRCCGELMLTAELAPSDQCYACEDKCHNS